MPRSSSKSLLSTAMLSSLFALAFVASGCGSPQCGDGLCGPSEFCVVYGSDVLGEPDTYHCRPLPQACADDKSCGCIERNQDVGTSTDLSFCFQSGGCAPRGTDLTVVCPGG